MPLCDGNGKTSAQLTNPIALLIRQRSPGGGISSVHPQLNYNYYTGSGTWGGSQSIILIGYDKDKNYLTTFYNEDTPRDGCHYDGVDITKTGPYLANNDFFELIKYVRIEIGRVGGEQH
jgi:hypothetical protein